MGEKVFVIRTGNSLRIFSTFEEALTVVFAHNTKAGMCLRFMYEDKEMYDLLMDEFVGNMWVDRSAYEQWREDKLAEYGITEDDLSVYTEVLFIEEVEVE